MLKNLTKGNDMDVEIEKLMKEFPVFFDQNAGENPFKYRGLEIDIGWISLVREMVLKLEKQAKLESRSPEKPVQCAQIKEKFGLLRCYLVNTSEAMQQIVHEFESKSAGVCESCGAPGKLYYQVWQHVKCEACEKKYQESGDQ